MTALEPLTPPQEFLDQARTLHIEFDGDDVRRLGHYLALLLECNERFNVTAIKDPETAWTRHMLDALTLLPYLREAEAKTIIDVGSGGGLPGIPLAIVCPDMHFTLLEATGKKARFCEQCATDLDLKNITVINDRAETIGTDHKTHREHYDLAMARAVGRLPVLLELTIPLVKIGGFVLAIKGEQADAEIEESRSALHALHAVVARSERTPTGTIVVIEKSRKTPRLYPRRPGEPKRAPL